MLTTGQGKWVRAAVILAIFVATIVSYANGIGNGFHYDDVHHIQQNPYIRSLGTLPLFFVDATTFDADPANAMYRPFVLVVNAYNATVLRGSLVGFHVVNLVFHLGTALLLMAIVEVLLRALAPSVAGTRRVVCAGVAALLFAVHPVQSEALNYLSARSELIVGFFSVLSIYLWMRVRLAEEKTSPLYLVGAFAAFAFALLSKEIAIVIPVILLAAEWITAPAGDRKRAFLRLHAPMWLLAIAYLAVRHAVLGSTGVELTAERFMRQGDVFTGGGRSIVVNLFTQAKAVALYLKLLVWPHPLSIEPAVEVSKTADVGVVLAALLHLGLISFAILRRRRYPLVALGILWFYLVLAPTSTIVPLNVVASEHRLYLALAGPAVAIVTMLVSLPLSTVVGGAGLVAGLCMAGTFLRNRDWSDDHVLWAKAAECAPRSPRARLNLGNACVARGELERAIDEYREAAALEPEFPITRINLGEALRQKGERDKDAASVREARTVFAKVVEEFPDSGIARFKLAFTHRTLGVLENDRNELLAAKAAFQELVDHNPNELYATLYLLGVEKDLGNTDALVAGLERARVAFPGVEIFGSQLGEAYLEAGRENEAAALFEELVKANAQNALAHHRLAEIYAKRGPEYADRVKEHLEAAERFDRRAEAGTGADFH
ncbi:MAG: tetratricopeptide repeat protein [Planctomycetes bacterium]|nr:tetratricopeptide repeat protein [Planctomycetota bacterium]MBI3846251.1 tetratricopeptide repeat protein [Planctomycetota bacterium]